MLVRNVAGKWFGSGIGQCQCELREKRLPASVVVLKGVDATGAHIENESQALPCGLNIRCRIENWSGIFAELERSENSDVVLGKGTENSVIEREEIYT